MRKISADTIFPISGAHIDNGIIVLGDEGKIIDVIDPSKISYEIEDLEKHKGIICPGFINTHCHLELSHLHNKLSIGKGLDFFIKEIESIRKTEQELIEDALLKAEAEMISNGIVAVGDISNTDNTFKQKAKGKLLYHTFIELLGFHVDRADTSFQKGVDLLRKYHEIMSAVGKEELAKPISLTPHAPYSASDKLLKLIEQYSQENRQILTIHNQESEEENELFLHKRGKILDRLKSFGIETESWQHPGSTSLRSVLPKLPNTTRVQLVHNTLTTEDEIKWAEEQHKSLYWCFCVNANLYIEKRLPQIKNFVKNNCKITIGTDSLASNHSLSILDELKVISAEVPDVSLNDLLTWATKNGAEFLGFEQLGTLEKGKRPGLNLLGNIESNRFTENSEVIKIT